MVIEIYFSTLTKVDILKLEYERMNLYLSFGSNCQEYNSQIHWQTLHENQILFMISQIVLEFISL